MSASIPQFWLGVGGRDASGLRNARSFQRLLLARQPDVRLDVVPGGAHTMPTWRDLVPPMLEWMTPLLTHAAQHPTPVKQVRKAHRSGKRPGRPTASPASRGSVQTPTSVGPSA